MSIWIFCSIVLCFLFYQLLLIYILTHWRQQTPFESKSPLTSKSDLKLDILIASRNEGEQLLDCIQSIILAKQDFHSLGKVIIVDDFSTDDSIEKIGKLKFAELEIISMSEYLISEDFSSKKVALSKGLEFASGDYIVQLDADVTIDRQYLSTVLDYIELRRPDFVTGPVVFNVTKGIFNSFQVLDLLGMMAVTQTGILTQKWFMANGANMIYKRSMMEFDTNGFASGDDIFGIQKIQERGGNIHFIKSLRAAVKTNAVETLGEFYSQRIRWATKNKYMKSLAMKLMMLIPYLTAILMTMAFIVCLLSWNFTVAFVLAVHLTVAMFINFLLLRDVAIFFKAEKALKHYIASFFFHHLYLIVIGTLSLLVTRYEWKGRRVK